MNKEIPTVKDFLNQQAKMVGYMDFYNFLFESDMLDKSILIPRWIEEYINEYYKTTNN